MFDCVGELFVECDCYLCGRGEYLLFESYCVWVFLCCAVFCWLIRVWSSISQYVSRCSLHMSDLWVCMRDVISKFNSEIEG